MLSESVQIGDYNFRIKLYPDSVDESRYFSVFVTCDSMVDPKNAKNDKFSSRLEKKSKKKKRSIPFGEASNAAAVSETAQPAQVPHPEEPKQKEKEYEQEQHQEWQHTPLPLLDPKRIPKRPSVAAQFIILMYNPEEPRSHYHMTFSHRFCPGAPDHGTMHFGFSKSDAAIRRRHQRAPIYKNDKLAFRAHVRLINDETGCLWERSNRENPYDSLMITGLQGICSSTFGISGGNVISAISAWMLLMPFRELLYSIKAPDPMTEPNRRPKPMLVALQKILYCLRTRPEGVTNAAYRLDDLLEAFEWYALDKSTDKYDTIEIWEILRSKLEQELEDTPLNGSLDRLFGPKRDRAVGMPCYRVPVRGMGTMQKAIDSTSDLVNAQHDAPQVLTIELERYIFDEKKRAWSKLSEKLKLDETVTVLGQEYKLFGFIVHKENAQSGSYYPVLRPDGSQGKWYMYNDNRDENKVMCLTRKAAVDAHEGTAKKGNNEHASVAYVVTYLRADVAAKAFDVSNEPEWDVSEAIVEDVKRDRALDSAYPNIFEAPTSIPAATNDEKTAEEAKKEEPAAEVKEYQFSVISSQIFEGHEGPGLLDLYEPKWEGSQHICTVTLRGDAKAEDMQAQVAEQIGGVKDHRQCKLWIVGGPEGTLWRPSLITTGKKDISGGSTDYDFNWIIDELIERCPDRRLWLHVIDEKDLPPLPPPVADPPKNEDNVQAIPPNPPPAAGVPEPADTVAMPDIQAVLNVQDQQMGGTQDENVPPVAEIIVSDMQVLDAPRPSTDSQVPTASGANVPANGVPPPENTIIPPELIIDVAGLPLAPPVGMTFGASVTPQAMSPDRLSRWHPSGTSPIIMTGDPPPPKRPDEIYFFLKTYEPKTHSLKAYGSYFVERTARIDRTIYKILGTDKQTKPLEFWEEDDIATARSLSVRNSFAREELVNGCIIVIQDQLSDETKNNLRGEGIFVDPHAYLRALGEERTFPNLANGTFTLNYFSSEYFSGSLRYHMPHGEGKKIYHNADVYTGSFVMGQRHGHGQMTFANGDTYEGQWVNGLQQGQGTSIELETGNRYEGNWKVGKKYGEGVTYWRMAQEEQRSCKICWEEEADAVFIDCGHVVSCLACAKQVRDCPICRRSVSKAIKLYLVA